MRPLFSMATGALSGVEIIEVGDLGWALVAIGRVESIETLQSLSLAERAGLEASGLPPEDMEP